MRPANGMENLLVEPGNLGTKLVIGSFDSGVAIHISASLAEVGVAADMVEVLFSVDDD